MDSGHPTDSGDLLAEVEDDPIPEPVTDPDDPSYVEPAEGATPVDGEG